MPFVSLTQNFEDVMLWRALKDVDRCFYIKLRQAISNVSACATMYFVSNPGLSSLDETIACGQGVFGGTSAAAEIEVTTLSALWADHVPVGQDVHFLKVDVEGLEEAVLCGNDWTQNRPWIVGVEVTKPMSQEKSCQSWDQILTGADYVLAYADGLSRFYVGVERGYLAEAFRYPRIVFDDMIRLRLQMAEAQAAAVKSACSQLETRLQVTEAQAAAVEKLLRYTTESRNEMICENRELVSYNSYLKDRAAWERLLFRTDGRPVKLLCRILFHNNGKPRGVFRKYILNSAGKPRRVFHYWMTSPSYLALPGAVQVPSQPPSQSEGGDVWLQPVWRNLIDVDNTDEFDLDALMERIRAEVAAAKHGASA
jgi:FkbM family methyltransferase